MAKHDDDGVGHQSTPGTVAGGMEEHDAVNAVGLAQ